MFSLRIAASIGTSLSLTMLVVLAGAVTLIGCRQQAQEWATRESLSRSEFKPPPKVDAPACALNTGFERRVGHNFYKSHMQRLLDGDESTGKSPSH